MPHHVEVHLSTLAQLLPTTSTRRAPQLQTLCNSPPPVKSSTRKHRQLRPAGMKLLLPVLATVAVVSWSPAAALEAASLHLRVYEEKDASCTITNESQCDGQNWTGSTCCADSSYECRWDDYGQNVKRCQKIAGGGGGGGGGGGSNNNACTITNESQCDGQNWTGSTCCADSSYECRWDDYGQNVKRCQKKFVQDDSTPASDSDSYSAESDSDSFFSDSDSYSSESDSDSYFSDSESYSADSDSDSGSKPLYISDSDSGSDCDGCGIIWVDDWADCTDANKYCENDTSWCIYHSEYYAQCKPETLPSGELCGQSDGTNEWLYDYCPSGESCEQQGTDYRCTKITSKHHKMSTYTYVDDWGNCLAPNTKCKGSSQCVKYSPYYAQCKPATLPAGELCGQNDGTNVWKYDHCPAGQTCKQNGSDFRCTKTTSQHKKNVDNQKYHVYVENGAECTDQEHVICNSGTCVKHSTGYWQCMPTTLAAGALCGQKDGTNNWKYNHCPSGQTCKKSGTSYYCTGSSTTTYTYVDDWGNCLASNTKCKGSSQCVKYSAYYAQCKPATLPSGELCGQNDGTNVWKYDHCTAGETCKQNGNDFRCTKSRKHHKMSTYTYVDDWGNCLAPNTKCKGSSQCVKYSPYYAQCKPATLPAGELCGQNDGTNVWKYDHCPAGQSCKQNGSDFRCTKTTSKHHKMSSYTYVDDWAACTPPNFKCKGTSVCVKYSQYYSQCKPATLPQGELCGQNDGTNVWKYDHCPAGQKCKQNGTDFRCS